MLPIRFINTTSNKKPLSLLLKKIRVVLEQITQSPKYSNRTIKPANDQYYRINSLHKYNFETPQVKYPTL